MTDMMSVIAVYLSPWGNLWGKGGGTYRLRPAPGHGIKDRGVGPSCLGQAISEGSSHISREVHSASGI